MTRYKVPSREVYHLWANEAQDYASNAQGNVSFRDSGAYSYAALIGRIVRRKGKMRAYLLTTQTWSVTTSGHQSMLRSAIPEGARVFHVYPLDYIDSPSLHKERIANYKERIATLALKAKRARKAWSIESYQESVADLVQEAKDYCAYFGLRAPKLDVDTLRTDLETLRAKEAEEQRTREARQNARIEELRKEWDAMAPKWISGEIDSMPMGYSDVLLRVHGDELDGGDLIIETSKGARVPYSVALSLFSRWLSGNVQHGDKVGPYTVSRVNGVESITIGCHVIKMTEARRFAEQEDWIGNDVQPDATWSDGDVRADLIDRLHA